MIYTLKLAMQQYFDGDSFKPIQPNEVKTLVREAENLFANQEYDSCINKIVVANKLLSFLEASNSVNIRRTAIRGFSNVEKRLPSITWFDAGTYQIVQSGASINIEEDARSALQFMTDLAAKI